MSSFARPDVADQNCEEAGHKHDEACHCHNQTTANPQRIDQTNVSIGDVCVLKVVKEVGAVRHKTCNPNGQVDVHSFGCGDVEMVGEGAMN